DSVTIDSSANFAGGIRVLGGDAVGLGDLVVLNATAGDDVIGVTTSSGAVTGVVGGTVSLEGVERLSIVGTGTATGDDVSVIGLGNVTGLEQITVTQNSNAGDSLSVTGTVDHDTIEFRATSGTTGEITGEGSSLLIAYSNRLDTSSLTVSGGSAGFDILRVQGGSGADTVTSGSATRITSAGSVDLGSNLDRLDIVTGSGDDTVTLSQYIRRHIRPAIRYTHSQWRFACVEEYFQVSRW
ncbi:MAG: hypothetical protein ABGZ17_30160, partial [Planctomycetaceae bacterium]